EQLNDTRKELDQKIEAVRHDLSDKIEAVRNELKSDIQGVRIEVSSLKNLIIATAFAMIATVAGAAFWVGSHINV
ncbi:DUF1640 domain-containing protein, partial [Vibrio splendidus]